MRKRFQGFVVGLLVCTIFFCIPVLGAGITKTIKAVFNQVTVKIDGKAVNGDRISYNKNVYISAKSISDLLGKTYSVDKSGNVTITKRGVPIQTSPNIEKGKKINFLDKALDKRIRQIINKPIGDIYEGDVSNIKSLGIYDKTMIVASLEGVQYLKGLKSIVIVPASDLSDIKPLANLLNLTEISLVNKKINDLLPLKKLINLEKLEVGGNPITDIKVLKSLKKLKSSQYLTITSDNKYFYLGFKGTLVSSGKFYLTYHDGITIDENGKYYCNFYSVIDLLNASKNQYNISKSDNPYIDGIAHINGSYFKNESKEIYTSIENSYIEGKIINNDGSLFYEYSLQPNKEKGVIKLEKNTHNYLCSIDDIFKTFGISYSVEFDKDKKLYGFKF